MPKLMLVLRSASRSARLEGGGTTQPYATRARSQRDSLVDPHLKILFDTSHMVEGKVNGNE